MAVIKRRKKKMSVLFSRSKICGFFTKIAAFLFSKAENSITGKIFSSYHEKSFERGLLYRIIGKLDLGKRFFRPVKRTVSKYVSNSFLLNKLNAYLKGFLFTKLNVYGLMCVTVGVGFLLVEILKLYSGIIPTLSFLDTFVSVLLCLISVPLLFSSSTVSEAVCVSKNASAVVFGWFGCKKNSFEKNEGLKGHTRTALPLALLLCLTSWWVRPVELLMGIVIAIFALAVFYSPETGVVGFILCLPFLYWEKAAVFIIYIAICFFFKYIRGKRTVKFDPLSVSVLMVAFVVLFSYLTADRSLLSREATVQCLYGICTFFIFVNLIKSKKWIKRCMNSLSLSCLLVAVYGIIGYSVQRFGNQYLIYVFESLGSNTGISYFGETAYLAQYLTAVLPFVFFIRKNNSKTEGVITFMAFVTGVVCLVLTDEIKALVCLLAGFALFFMLYSKKSLAFMLFCLCIISVAAVVLPTHIFDKVGFLKGLSEAVTVNIENTVSQIKQLPSLLFGTGLGTSHIYMTNSLGFGFILTAEIGVTGLVMFIIMLFFGVQKNTTMYSNGCSKDGKVVSLAAIASVVALLLTGESVDIFADYRITFMFWLCMGMVACVSGTERNMINVIEDSEE